MKNLLIIVSIVFINTSIQSQTKYISSESYKFKNEVENVKKIRAIIISDNEIKIDFYVGGTQPLNLKVNEIKEKEYNSHGKGIMKWYYCIRVDKDAFSGKNSEYVIITDKNIISSSLITVCQKVDEVTYIKTNYWVD